MIRKLIVVVVLAVLVVFTLKYLFWGAVIPTTVVVIGQLVAIGFLIRYFLLLIAVDILNERLRKIYDKDKKQ